MDCGLRTGPRNLVIGVKLNGLEMAEQRIPVLAREEGQDPVEPRRRQLLALVWMSSGRSPHRLRPQSKCPRGLNRGFRRAKNDIGST